MLRSLPRLVFLTLLLAPCELRADIAGALIGGDFVGGDRSDPFLTRVALRPDDGPEVRRTNGALDGITAAPSSLSYDWSTDTLGVIESTYVRVGSLMPSGQDGLHFERFSAWSDVQAAQPSIVLDPVEESVYYTGESPSAIHFGTYAGGAGVAPKQAPAAPLHGLQLLGIGVLPWDAGGERTTFAIAAERRGVLGNTADRRVLLSFPANSDRLSEQARFDPWDVDGPLAGAASAAAIDPLRLALYTQRDGAFSMTDLVTGRSQALGPFPEFSPSGGLAVDVYTGKLYALGSKGAGSLHDLWEIDPMNPAAFPTRIAELGLNSPTSMTIFVTPPGDLNYDGRVDLSDFGSMKAHFGSTGTRADGELTGDDTIDLSDFGILKANFGAGMGPQKALNQVPEPSGHCLAILALACLRSWYRRSRATST